MCTSKCKCQSIIVTVASLLNARNTINFYCTYKSGILMNKITVKVFCSVLFITCEHSSRRVDITHMIRNEVILCSEQSKCHNLADTRMKYSCQYYVQHYTSPSDL